MMRHSRGLRAQKWLLRGIVRLPLALMLVFLLGLLPGWATAPCPAVPHVQVMITNSPLAAPTQTGPSPACPCCPDQGANCTFGTGMAGIFPRSSANLTIGQAVSAIYPLPAASFPPGRTISPTAPPPRRIG